MPKVGSGMLGNPTLSGFHEKLFSAVTSLHSLSYRGDEVHYCSSISTAKSLQSRYITATAVLCFLVQPHFCPFHYPLAPSSATFLPPPLSSGSCSSYISALTAVLCLLVQSHFHPHCCPLLSGPDKFLPYQLSSV